MKRPQITVSSHGTVPFVLAGVFVVLEGYAKSLAPVSAIVLRVLAGLCLAAAGIWIVVSRRATTHELADFYERAPESVRRFYGSAFWIRRFKSYESYTGFKLVVGGIAAFLIGFAFIAVAIRDFLAVVR